MKYLPVSTLLALMPACYADPGPRPRDGAVLPAPGPGETTPDGGPRPGPDAAPADRTAAPDRPLPAERPPADAADPIEAAAPAPLPPQPAPLPPDLAARMDFFRSDVVHRIEITVDPEHWRAYLAEHRRFDSDAEKQWFQADFRIDGTDLRAVAFHSFGWGSRSGNGRKPNLSLDIDRIVPGQKLRGIERMRIKNNGQDTSGLRQTILYEAMRASNLMAPRSTFANLTVNGEPYGFYFVEESFTSGFVRERTGNGDGAAYEPAGCQGFLPARGGCAGLAEYFSSNFNPLAPGSDRLVGLCQALNGPPAQLVPAVSPYILLSEWIDQVAIDTALAGNRDGFSSAGANFRLYHDTALDRLRLVILGPDDTFVPESLPEPSFVAPRATRSCREENRAYRDVFLEQLVATPEGLAMYQAAVRRLRIGVLGAGRISQRLDELWAVVAEHARADPLRSPDLDVDASKDAIKQYVDLRWRALEAAGF